MMAARWRYRLIKSCSARVKKNDHDFENLTNLFRIIFSSPKCSLYSDFIGRKVLDTYYLSHIVWPIDADRPTELDETHNGQFDPHNSILELLLPTQTLIFRISNPSHNISYYIWLPYKKTEMQGLILYESYSIHRAALIKT